MKGFKSKFSLVVFVLIAFLATASVFSPPDIKAQDTTFYTSAGSGDDYTVLVSFRKDSTQNTVTDWFPFTELQQKSLYYTHKYSNTNYGYSAGNDTMQCILQVKDRWDLIVNSDTIGTGSEGSEIMVSSGVSAQYTVTPKKFGKDARFVYVNKVSGTHKNGWGSEVGTLIGVSTHLK